MAEILVPDGVSAVATGVNPEGHRWMNTFWWDLAGGGFSSGTATSIAGFLADAYALLAPRLSVAWSLDDFIITDRRTAGAAQFHETPSVPLVGALSDQPLPGMVSGLVSWTTDFRGREGRGRTYLTGWTEASSNGGGVEGASQTAMADFADEILSHSNFAVASLYKGVALATTGSRRKVPIPRPGGGILHDFLDKQVHPSWYTQRRRRA